MVNLIDPSNLIEAVINRAFKKLELIGWKVCEIVTPTR